jgi:iron only hydrogenase large subunit-like protein
VLSVLNAHPTIDSALLSQHSYQAADTCHAIKGISEKSRVFVASVSPQTRASLAATLRISEAQAGQVIEQLLAGPQGLQTGGKYGSHFNWVFDTDTVRDIALVLATDEVYSSIPSSEQLNFAYPKGKENKLPIITSACPGWVCYAEKTHPYMLPHLSRLKSPQALAGTLIKSILSQKLGISPHQIWHLALMPCFDKKLEASRSELTSASWHPSFSTESAVRDVDCVITARELLSLAAARNIYISELPLQNVRQPLFPDSVISQLLFPSRRNVPKLRESGTSGGFLYHIISALAVQKPHTRISIVRGRNDDVIEYKLLDKRTGDEIIKMARYYGFRNIQNLVRKLKPKNDSRMLVPARRNPGTNGSSKNSSTSHSNDYTYIEVMACPGGCTNGGGQVKVDELGQIRREDIAPLPPSSDEPGRATLKAQRDWLANIDEAYFSAESSSDDEVSCEVIVNESGTVHVSREDSEVDWRKNHLDAVNGISHAYIHNVLDHWVRITGISLEQLAWTSYREVDSDVGKTKGRKSDMERVASLAQTIGGGW